jgi:hypothetical protein
MSDSRARLGLAVFCVLGAQFLSPSCDAHFRDPQNHGASADEPTVKESAQSKTDRPVSQVDSPDPRPTGENRLGRQLLKNIADDQKAIWTSPTRLRWVDADWLLPLGAVAGGMLATDAEYSKHLSLSSNGIRYSNDVSNYGIGALVGVGGGMYLWGRATHDDHKRETGMLAGEAAIDSFAAVYALKYAFGRERPRPNYQGRFWQGGDSFPSEHAAAAWSIASIIAHEYPGPLTSLLAYGMASAVSISRINAEEHFPTDVLVGSAIGWYVAQRVYRKHHDPTLGGVVWETYAESRDSEGKGLVRGTAYVQLDSWIYPAIERLAAMGYVNEHFLGMRPWTRLECARLVQDADDRIRGEQGESASARSLYDALWREFEEDLEAEDDGRDEGSLRLESIYGRAMQISGTPLNDSYHFGQTIINNYGRPYQQGFNSYDGLSGWARKGRFTIYLRGEYQHAPSAPAYSSAVRNEIAALDFTPVQPGTPIATTNQFRLLDTYIGARAGDWFLSFGKQSLWWGPAKGSALIFSNNAEPIYMFRASRIAPFTLPWIFRWLGPMKWDVFFGKLSGNHFPPRPMLHGEKVSFKPTRNLEFGFSRTAEIGGVGRPLTLGSIWRSYVSVTSPVHETPANDPGKRTGGFDFSYKLPFVRDWLSIYTDSLADDDPSPLAAPRRAGVNPGIYLARFPKIPKLDLRVEGVNTNLVTFRSTAGQFIYFDSFYHELYTNKSNLIGSYIGREGTGIQAWSSYWFNARDSVQFGYRHVKVASDFIPGGETMNDGSVKVEWLVHKDISVSAFLQYEKWRAPFLSPSAQTNWTSTFEISFQPHGWNLPRQRPQGAALHVDEPTTQ